MASGTYDIITVGGGLGGASLAKAMAEHGARVLVLERETHFKDRVRGEQMTSWGVGEARQLGIHELLRHTCGHEMRWWQTYVGSMAFERRDCVATTPQHAPQLMFYHPAMQEVLLQAAADAGAEVRRGVWVRDVRPGGEPTVIVEQERGIEELPARLVVGVDGRTSIVRKWADFSVSQNPPRRLIAGVFFEGMEAVPEDTAHLQINPDLGQVVFLAPQGGGRVRAYHVYRHNAPHRLQGAADVPRFIEASIRTGAPAEFYAGVQAAGPLASFDGADTWVEHPYRAGVALVGDAAASNRSVFWVGLVPHRARCAGSA